MPGGKDIHATRLGACLTIILVLLLVFYGGLQLQRLIHFEETVIMESVRDAHFDTDETMSTEKDQFNIAFAITAYDSNQEPIDDYRYGKIAAKIVQWGFSDTQGVDIGGNLDHHNCSREELGLDEPDSDKAKFWPLHDNSYNDVNFYSKKLKCLDNGITIQGDYNSAKAKILKITFEKCNNETLLVERNKTATLEERHDGIEL